MRMDNEIIKALEQHLERNNGLAKWEALKALSIIYHQKAEIERLRNDFMGECMLSKCTREAEIASEARKEFAERLIEEKSWDCPYETENAHYVMVVCVGDIEDLLAEMESNE